MFGPVLFAASGRVLRVVVWCATRAVTWASTGLALALALAFAPSGVAHAQSRFDERARSYMIEHCMEETAKRIEPGAMITVTFASGEMLTGSFIRASAETLVVCPYGLANRGGGQLPLEKPRIRSLRFDNKPHRSLATGLLGFAVGYVVAAGVAVIAVESTEGGLSYADWPTIVGALAVGSTVGFIAGYGYRMRHPGESLIQCQ